MSEKRKKTAGKGSSLRKLLLTTTIGTFLFLAALAILALVLTKRDIPFRYFPIMLYILLPLCGFVSAVAAGISFREMKGFAAGLLAAAITSVVLFLVLFFANAMQLDAKHFFIFPVAVLCGLPGGIIGANLR